MAILTEHEAGIWGATLATVQEQRARIAQLEAALAAIAALDPYPADVWTPLDAAELVAVLAALDTSGVRHARDRSFAHWGRQVGARYRALAREALAPETEPQL